jgi:chromosomal replication initiation ATPase DnaA
MSEDEIIEMVADHEDVSVEKLRSGAKAKEYTDTRALIWHVLKVSAEMSYDDIGLKWNTSGGGVRAAIKRLEVRLKNKSVRDNVDKIIAKIA